MQNQSIAEHSYSYMLNVDAIQFESGTPLDSTERVLWGTRRDQSEKKPADLVETGLLQGDGALDIETAEGDNRGIQSRNPSLKTTGTHDDLPRSRRARSSRASSFSDFEDSPSSWQPQGMDVPSREPWEHCRKLASAYDSEMCSAWKAEIDNLLIFAGLFSATVTAFTIDSYKWLQPDSGEYNAQVLALIYEELNPTTGIQKLSTISDPLPQNLVVRINIYWFLSLTLGLATVLIGIIVAQWLREYQREMSLSSQGRLSLRQMRYEGLIFWQVPRIISFLPLFLQLGFVLFLVGILELLWNIDMLVAIAVTIPIGLVFLFLLATVALPAVQYLIPGDGHLQIPQCAYKSPQSLGVIRFIISLSALLPRSMKYALSKYSTLERLFNSSFWWSWEHFDALWRKLRDTGFFLFDAKRSLDIVKSLDWLVVTYDENAENILSILQCLQQLPFNSAIQVVRNTCLRLKGPQALDDFDNLMEGNSLSTQVSQDVLTVAFLCGYQEPHPLLRTTYWTSQIRLMNINSIPRHLLVWCGADLSLHELPPYLQLRLIRSLNELVKHDLASPLDIQNVWRILHTLFNSETDSTEFEASDSHIDGCFKLFDSLDMWLISSGSMDLSNRVKLCMEGIRLVVYDGFFQRWGSNVYYDKLLTFAQTLDDSLKHPQVGGLANALRFDNNSYFSPLADTWPDYKHWISSGNLVYVTVEFRRIRASSASSLVSNTDPVAKTS